VAAQGWITAGGCVAGGGAALVLLGYAGRAAWAGVISFRSAPPIACRGHCRKASGQRASLQLRHYCPARRSSSAKGGAVCQRMRHARFAATLFKRGKTLVEL